MNAPKLHHYVPQFHLRRFADENGRIWVWDRREDRVFQTSSSSIAAETQFYRLTQYEALGHDPATLEKQLSDLEGDVAKITDQWLTWLPEMKPMDEVPIPKPNRDLVALYLAVQYLRTADTREILALLAEQHDERALTPTALRELHTECMWDEDTFNRLATRFKRSTWVFARNDTATPFVTSDNPVAFRTSDNRQWFKAGFASQGTYLVFPMAPQFVLYGYPREKPWRPLNGFKNRLSPVTLTSEMVESENSGQVFMSSRFVVSNRANFDFEREFARSIGTDLYAPK